MSNTTELSTALVAQIQAEHELANAFASSAKQNVEEAVKHAFQAGAHIHDLDGLTKGHALAIVRDQCPNIGIDRAKAYKSIFETQRKRECLAPDHRQLLMLGIVPEHAQETATEPTTPGRVDSDRFVSWVGKVKGWLQEQTRERPVETWDEDERDVLVATLEPIVEIYNRAKQ